MPPPGKAALITKYAGYGYCSFNVDNRPWLLLPTGTPASAN